MTLGSLAAGLALVACGTAPTIAAPSGTAKVAIAATIDPTSACVELLDPTVVATSLGYRAATGLSATGEHATVSAPFAPDTRPTLTCEFADSEGYGTRYVVRLHPADGSPRGPTSGIPTVTAHGVTVAGSAAGISPQDPRYLIPLFTAAATRADFEP